MRPQVISVPYRYDRFEEGLGLGPSRLLEIGLAERAAAVHQAILEDADRDDDRTAVNIGILGRSTAALVAQARTTGDPVLVVAGDDTAAIGVVAGLQASDGASRALGVVWIDAHGDFNTPDTSYSGILAGMPLAVLAGLAGPRWREAAGLEAPVPVERMVLVGARDLDKAEEELIRGHNLQRVSVQDVRKEEGFATPLARLAATCESLYVNIDMDVLNPHLTPSATTQSEGGFELDELGAVLRAALKTGLVSAVTLTSLNPLGGARGQVSTRSAWQIIQTILTEWDTVPAPPADVS
jgi:arginase